MGLLDSAIISARALLKAILAEHCSGVCLCQGMVGSLISILGGTGSFVLSWGSRLGFRVGMATGPVDGIAG